jgi:4-hydroxy-2-oxoheptanedioate aldolase
MSTQKPLKARIAAREPLNGCFVQIASIALIEMVAYAGFDFAILDQKHGPAAGESLENQIRAADAAGIPVLVRVQANRPDVVLHVLDAGAGGVLAPHVRNAGDAEALVQAAHYPPRGNSRGCDDVARGTLRDGRGCRASRAGADPNRRDASDRGPGSARRGEAIAEVPGVDAILIGPSDLAVSLGHRGTPRIATW